MGLYEGIKDVAKVVQQADNVELYKQLIDLSAQALDMQDEISKLKEENENLKKKEDISSKIVRHKALYLTKQGDEPDIIYCSHCWDSKELLIQLKRLEHSGQYECPHCDNKGVYNKTLNEEAKKKQIEAIGHMNSHLSRKSPWNI